MADAYTPQLALIKPEVGASRDTWGTKWNQNADILDQFVSQFCVVGMIADFAGPTAPSGWLICDGRNVSRTTYSKLFAVIGGYWGAGDGSTTFGLPNMNGRSGVGPGAFTDESGASYTLGFTSLQGFVTRTITQAYLPNYTLSVSAGGIHDHGGSVLGSGAHTHATDATGGHDHGGATLANNVDHTHHGATTTAGNHQHSVTLPNSGTGAAAGGSSVMSSVFGTTGYQTDFQGTHNHEFTSDGASNNHLHAITLDGVHTHTALGVADHIHAIPASVSHVHTVTLGGGGSSLKTLSPIAVVTKIIYAGAEAAIITAADIAPAPTSPDTHQEIENLREEIAALRALFETPRARMLSAPSRGPH
jgi:microcystin-dependent protein